MLSLKFMDAFSAGFIFVYGPPAELARYTLYPATEVLELAFHDRSTVCCNVAPDPLAVSDAEPEELLKNEIFAEALPVLVGEKVTVNGTLCPAAIVTGNVSPPRVNCELLEVVDESVTLPPLAVTLPLWL